MDRVVDVMQTGEEDSDLLFFSSSLEMVEGDWGLPEEGSSLMVGMGGGGGGGEKQDVPVFTDDMMDGLF